MAFMKREKAYWKTWHQPILTSNTSYGVLTASNYNGDSVMPYKIFDNDVNTQWQTSQGVTSATILWELPVTLKIYGITVRSRSGNRPNLTCAIYTDSTKTIPIGNQFTSNVAGSNNVVQGIPQEGIITNKIFFDCSSNSDYLGIDEVYITADYYDEHYTYKAYNIMRRQRAYFKYKTWNQPILTSATSYGTITASSDHSTDSSEPWQIFDMGATVGKRFLFTGSSSEWLMWQLPEPIKISSCTVYNSSETSYLNRFPKSITLQVSDDGSVWKTVGSASDYTQPGDKESISFVCNSDKAYSYIRWTFANTFGASPMAVGLIKINAKKITDGTSSDYDFYKDSYKAYEIKDTQWETVTQRFDYTGELQTYTVPEGVTSVQVDCVAASGLDGTESTGGKGGRVKTKLSVTPGQELKVWVGKVPDTTKTAEYNASDIRTSNADITSEEGLNSRLVVAGAGGNGTAVNWIDGYGGDGGGLVGASATAGYGTNPTGGTQTAGGTKGINGANYGGKNGNDGLFGLGGDGAVWGSGKGGAGGAGWYGGGGGNCCLGSNITGVIDACGGAGGSSYTDPELCSEVKHTQGYQSGNGYVKITYKRRKL